MRRNTPSQSPSLVWWKILMVGYHGVSSRPRGQRQSLTEQFASQTRTPRPPARWATAESGAITRSRCVMMAAVAVKSAARAGQLGDRKPPGAGLELIQPMFNLQRDQPDAWQLGQWGKLRERERSPVIGAMRWVSLPGDPDHKRLHNSAGDGSIRGGAAALDLDI